MQRVYTSTAHFRAPFQTSNISFAGLGSAYPSAWPNGRSYWTTADYRAPYDDGYYQSGALRGLSGIGDYKPVFAGIGAAFVLGGAIGAIFSKRGRRLAGTASGAFGAALVGIVASGVTHVTEK